MSFNLFPGFNDRWLGYLDSQIGTDPKDRNYSISILATQADALDMAPNHT